MKKYFLLAFVLAPLFLTASPKYWIYLKTKDKNAAPAVSPLTLENRQKLGIPVFDETDLPVNVAFESALRDNSVHVVNRSKWLNAVSAVMTGEQVERVRQLDFVQDVVMIDPGFYIARTQPIEKANNNVANPNVPPSKKPIITTLLSIAVRTTPTCSLKR